jgi:hypothetical protein
MQMLLNMMAEFAGNCNGVNFCLGTLLNALASKPGFFYNGISLRKVSL